MALTVACLSILSGEGRRGQGLRAVFSTPAVLIRLDGGCLETGLSLMLGMRWQTTAGSPFYFPTSGKSAVEWGWVGISDYADAPLEPVGLGDSGENLKDVNERGR